MSQVYTVNPNAHLTLDREVAEIKCEVGSVSAIDAEDNSTTIEEGDSFVPAPGFVNVGSLRGASITVTYADEVEPAAPRGDTDSDSPTGGTGPYEDRTVPELKALAKERGIKLPSDAKKADIEDALRGN